MLDFYLIVSDYRAAYRKRWLALANKLIPPNVFYFEQDGLAAKYAVLSEADFKRSTGRKPVTCRCGRGLRSRRGWYGRRTIRRASEPSSREPRRADLARGGRAGSRASAARLWRRAFALTYSAELRAERQRPRGVGRRYRARTVRAVHCAGARGDSQTAPTLGSWASATRIEGKALTCFAWPRRARPSPGGPDYIIWKINRHAGTKIELTPWQRRHPLLAGLSLLPRLLRSGAVR